MKLITNDSVTTEEMFETVTILKSLVKGQIMTLTPCTINFHVFIKITYISFLGQTL